jgi:hypothetical protein
MDNATTEMNKMMTDAMAQLGLSPAELPQDVLEGMPSELRAAMESGEGIAFPVGIENLDEALNMLKGLLDDDGPSTQARFQMVLDLAQASAQRMAQVGAYMVPAVRALCTTGADRGLEGYNDAINEHVMAAAEDAWRMYRSAERELRSQALQGKAFGNPLHVLHQRIVNIKGCLQPYNKHAGAVLLEVLLTIPVTNGLQEYGAIMTLCCDRNRELQGMDEALAQLVFEAILEFDGAMDSIDKETHAPADGRNAKRLVEMCDRVLTGFPQGVESGLLPQDALLRSYGGRDKFFDLIDTYDLEPMNEMGDLETQVMAWLVKIEGVSRVHDALQECFQEHVMKLAVLIDLASAHSEKTRTTVEGGMRDALDVIIPVSVRRLNANVFDEGDATGIIDEYEEALEAMQKGWGHVLGALDEDALVKHLQAHALEEFLNCFPQMSRLARSYRRSLEILFVSETDAMAFAHKVLDGVLDRIPTATQKLVDEYGSMELAGRPQETRAMQAQFAAALGAGASAKQALIGSVVTGTMQGLDRLEKLVLDGDEAEKLEGDKPAEQLTPGE